MQQIQSTSLSDLIVRDTNTAVMQPNAFIATQRVASDVIPLNPQAPQLVIGTNDDNATVAGQPGVDNTIVAGLGMNQQLTGGGTVITLNSLPDRLQRYDHGLQSGNRYDGLREYHDAGRLQ
jgi:peroxidase